MIKLKLFFQICIIGKTSMAICSLLPDGDGVAPFCQHFRSIKCEERFS